MRFLLTSAGIKNTSIHNALVELLGKPIAESSALCIPTALYAIPGGAGHAWRLISGRATEPMCELGWKSLGVLELTIPWPTQNNGPLVCRCRGTRLTIRPPSK